MSALDDRQLRDEAVRDRIRAAEDFLDPSMFPSNTAPKPLNKADNV